MYVSGTVGASSSPPTAVSAPAIANAITATHRRFRPMSSAARGESADATSAWPTMVRRRKSVRPIAAPSATTVSTAYCGWTSTPPTSQARSDTAEYERGTSPNVASSAASANSAIPTVMMRLASGVVRPRTPTATTATSVAITAVASAASGAARTSDMCFPSPYVSRPPRTANTPCAKFTIPVALKTRTSDIPTIANTEPVEIPTTTSWKNVVTSRPPRHRPGTRVGPRRALRDLDSPPR